MKKVMIALGILILGGLAGCGKSAEESMVGKWKQVDGTQTIEFFKDGTVTVVDKGEPPLNGDYKFIDKNQIRMNIALFGPITAEISPSLDEITLTNPFGKTEKYRRYDDKTKGLVQGEREATKRKLSKKEASLVGKYVAQTDDESQIFLELKRDGMALLRHSYESFVWAARWVPSHKPHAPGLFLYQHNMDTARTIWPYRAGDGEKEIGTEPRPIRVDSLHFIDDILRKQQEAKLIKLEKVWDWKGEVAYPHTVELWNKYIGKLGETIDEKGESHDRICLLELERISNFTPANWERPREADGNGSLFEVLEWEIRGDKIVIYGQAGEFLELEIKGNNLVDKRNNIKLVKQDGPFPLPTSLPTPSKPESTTQPPPPATPSLDEKEKLGQQINTKLEAYSNKDSFPLPPISLTLRTTAPDLVEKVETIYFTALDYQFYSLRSLHFAKDFLNKGEVAKSKKYIEKAERYYNFATSLQRDSFTVLDSTYSAAQWTVVYKASRTALGFTATGLGIGASTLFDLGTLYTDYSLDKSTMPLEEAKKNLIAKAISNVLLRSTGASDLIGDTVKQGWGSSRAFPVLQKIMGSSEFKDAVLREFMRLGGDVGDYAAKKTIEETLERVLRGSLEVNGEKADSTIRSEPVHSEEYVVPIK